MRQQRPRHPGEESCQRVGERLVAAGTQPQGTRRDLVGADGRQHITQVRGADPEHHEQRDRQHHQVELVVVLGNQQPQPEDLRGRDAGEPVGALGERIPASDHRQHDVAEGQGRHGHVVTAESPDRQGHQGGQHRRDHPGQQQGHQEGQVQAHHQQRRGVGADGHGRGLSQGDLPGRPGQQRHGDRDDGVDRHLGADGAEHRTAQQRHRQARDQGEQHPVPPRQPGWAAGPEEGAGHGFG